MLWRETGFLCKETESTDSLRKARKTYEKRQVLCNEKGVKRSEFYQAQAQGYRPELCVEVKAMEYRRSDTHFEYCGEMYRIIRTYPVKNECIELVCQSLVNQS